MALTGAESLKLIQEAVRRRKEGLPPLFPRAKIDPEKMEAIQAKVEAEQAKAKAKA